MSRALLLTLMDDLVRDEAGKLSADARGRALDLAVQQYGQDVPVPVTADVVAPGGYVIPYPAAFTSGSTVLAVEYPLGQMPPALLSADLHWAYDSPAGPVLMLARKLTAGDVVRVSFSIPAADADAVPMVHLEAVASYAAALLHDQLASAKSADVDSSLLADRVSNGGKAREYAERAETQRQRYHDLLGIDRKRQEPASALVQAASPAGDGGRRMFHWRGRR